MSYWGAMAEAGSNLALCIAVESGMWVDKTLCYKRCMWNLTRVGLINMSVQKRLHGLIQHVKKDTLAINNPNLYGIPAPKRTVEFIRREQQLLCQAVWDGLALLEERLPVGHQGLDFLEQLMLHDPGLARGIDWHFGYVLFTQKLLMIKQRYNMSINQASINKSRNYMAISGLHWVLCFCTVTGTRLFSSVKKRSSISISSLSDAASSVSSFCVPSLSSSKGNSSSNMASISSSILPEASSSSSSSSSGRYLN